MSQAEFKDCQSCTRGTNNKAFNCPNRMSYGFATDWRPRCAQVYAHLQNSQFNDSHSQRMFLTHNAEDLMADNAKAFYMTMACGPCKEPYEVGTMLPEQTTQQCDSRTCTFRTTDPYGLGFARKYYDNDDEKKAKAAFIAAKEKEQAYFKNSSECCGSAAEDMEYYPIGGQVKSAYDRLAVPSGATMMSGGDRLRAVQ